MKKLRFWLKTIGILVVVLLFSTFAPILLTEAQSIQSRYEIFYLILIQIAVTILCTAVLLYHLKFRK